MIIAMDGPSGAGKTTVARELAARLGFSCLDTGAMYRSVAWLALEKGISLDNEEALGELARTSEIEFVNEPGNPAPKQVLIAGIDVTDAIRTAEIDKAVSPVSAAASVREALVAQQQRIGRSGNYVVEGRDIGTVVFPDADVKVYLTASAEERARRRVAQNETRDGLTDYEAVLAAIIARDEYDMNREVSPLRKAEDATLIDSTDMTISEVIDAICKLAEDAM